VTNLANFHQVAYVFYFSSFLTRNLKTKLLLSKFLQSSILQSFKLRYLYS